MTGLKLVPQSPASPDPALMAGSEPPPVFESVDVQSAGRLLETCRSVIAGGRALVEFTDLNRDLSRRSGVETVSVELAGLLDSSRLDQVRDALEESVMKGRKAMITQDGLQCLRRGERLLSEAKHALSGGGMVRSGFGLGSSGPSFLGGGIDSTSVVLGLGVGIVAIGVVAIMALLITDRR